MNILPITPRLQPKNNASNTISNNSSVIRPNSLNYLGQDSVSFGIKAPKGTFSDVILEGYTRLMPSYSAIGYKLLDTTQAIADKFENRGVKFFSNYCAKGVVKSAKSFISKLIRSGETPFDRIRTTLCVENPYDFKLIRDIINEYKLRGYEIAKIPAKTSGKRVLSYKPDFDIRLAGITENDTKILGPELQHCIGKPVSSGYEDIQMRLVDTNAKKGTPPLEVIILFGKNTLLAKEAESYYSYDIRRVLKNELHISEIENPKINTPAHRVKNNIEIICDTLKNQISKPLFFNAKNKDFYHSKTQLPVELSESTAKALLGLMEGMISKTKLHYSNEIKRINSDKFKLELQRLFKASEEYTERTDKTVYIKDLKETRSRLIKEIRLKREDDLRILNSAKERLDETIEKFGEKPSKVTE